MSAGGEKSASLKRAKSSRINNFGKRNSEPMADYDDEFAEAHAEFLRETMARRNSDVDVGEGTCNTDGLTPANELFFGLLV